MVQDPVYPGSATSAFFQGHTYGIWKFPDWGKIRATAVGLHHSHGTEGSELHPQLMEMLDP